MAESYKLTCEKRKCMRCSETVNHTVIQHYVNNDFIALETECCNCGDWHYHHFVVMSFPHN